MFQKEKKIIVEILHLSQNAVMESINKKPSSTDSSVPRKKRSRSASQEHEEIGEVAQKAIRTEGPSSKTCSYRVGIVREKKTMSINAFWGTFTLEIAEESPEKLIEKTFSDFWGKKIIPCLNKNKAVHLRIKKEEESPFSNEDLVLFQVNDNDCLALVASGENFLLGEGDNFFVYRVKDLLSSEEFALSIYRYPNNQLLGDKADLLRLFINDKTIVGSVVRQADEVETLEKMKTQSKREICLAPLAKEGTVEKLKKCESLEV